MSLPALQHNTVESLHGVCLWPDGCRAPADPVAPFGVTLQHGRVSLPEGVEPLWTRTDEGARYRSRLALYPHPDGLLLDVDCQGSGRLLITDRAIRVDWHEGGTPVDHYLRTTGLALWLELRGVPCLHANTLSRDGTAIGLVAPSRTGKTTLSAALTAVGWQPLTDDMAALHRLDEGFGVYPSGAEARLWPDAGRHFFTGAYDGCRRVHARFAKRVVPLPRAGVRNDRPQPLRRMYLLDRQPHGHGDIGLTALAPAEALVVLMQNSLLGDAGGALGIGRRRLAALAHLLADVPLIAVRYPSGFARLDDVRRAIETDLRQIG